MAIVANISTIAASPPTLANPAIANVSASNHLERPQRDAQGTSSGRPRRRILARRTGAAQSVFLVRSFILSPWVELLRMASTSVGFRFVVLTTADSFRNRSLRTLGWEGNRFGFLRKLPGALRHGAPSRCFASVRVVTAHRFTSTGLRAHRWSIIKAGFPGPRRRFHASSARETSLSTDGGKPSRRMFLIIGARIKAAGPDTSILNATSRPPPASFIV